MTHRSAVSILLPSLVVALVLGLAPCATLTAQEAAVSEDDGWEELESFGEEISVEVTNLEVWVTDDQGDPVKGLTRDDFQVYEDGEPVEVTNFSAYEGTTGSDRREDAPPWEVAPETTLEVSNEPAQLEAVEVPPDERLHLTVLVDNWNIRPADRARVFQDLRQFLAENLEAGDRVAVAVHDRSLQLVQRFTDRPADVVRTLDRLEKVAPQGLQIETERRSTLREIEEAMRAAEEAPGIVRGDGVCSVAIGQMMGAAQRYAATVQGHVQSSAGGLATLSHTLSGVPGRRAVLYVGNGLAQIPGLMMFEYIAELCPEERSQLAAFQNEYDLTWLYEEVAARANAAGVTFYMLEAESPAIDLGLDRASGAETSGGSAGGRPSTVNQNQSSGAGFGPAGSTGRSGRGGSTGRRFQPSIHAQRIESQDRESPLVLMAQQTGGRSFLNAADFSNDFRRLARDLRTYYSLGFRPNDPGDG
ncbi:MAG: VWA domain-containing protein, partial [Acidobacteriota bacterium]